MAWNGELNREANQEIWIVQLLEQEKAQATPNAAKLERQRAEVNGFLQWAEDMRGRYHEASYDEKRTALRVLGISVQLYKECDE